MPVDVDQAFEPRLNWRFGESLVVAVITADGSASGEIGAVLTAGAGDLDVRTVAPSGLETADAHAYVFHGLSAESPLEVVERLAEQVPGPLVLVFPATTTTKTMKAALRAGVAGLVRDSDVRAGLAATVQAVAGGQLVVPLELGRQIAKPVLSRRQKQVLGLVVLGLSNGEIAAKLHLSEHTIKCHLYSGFRKLGVSSRDEAVATILDPESGLGTGILSISETESEVATHGHR